MFPTDHALLNLLYEDLPLYVRNLSNKKATAQVCLTLFSLLAHLIAVSSAMENRGEPAQSNALALSDSG